MYENINFNLKKKNIKKQTKKKTKKQNKLKRKRKSIFVENHMGYDDIVCEFALCTPNLFD